MSWLIIVVPMAWRKRKTNQKLTTHNVVQLYVFKGWNFCLEFECRAIAQKNGLNERKQNKAVRILNSTANNPLLVNKPLLILDLCALIFMFLEINLTL